MTRENRRFPAIPSLRGTLVLARWRPRYFAAAKYSRHTAARLSLLPFSSRLDSRGLLLAIDGNSLCLGRQRAAFRRIRPINLLAALELQISAPQPCRTIAHRADFSPAFVWEVCHVRDRPLLPHSLPLLVAPA